MPYTASAMFVTHDIPSFYELFRKCIYNFSERISSSSNSIIKACLSPIIFIFSPIRRWYHTSPADLIGKTHSYFKLGHLQFYLIPMKCIIYIDMFVF